MFISSHRADDVGSQLDGKVFGRVTKAVEDHRQEGFGQVQVLEGVEIVLPSANPTVVSGRSRLPTSSDGLRSLASGLTLASGLP